MGGLDPRLIAVLCVIAIGMGVMNILLGYKRLLQVRRQGQQTAWYKQLTILVGIEYVLLGISFMLNISITNKWLPKSFSSTLLPIYLILLLAAGLLAGVVIFQSISNSRRGRTVQARVQPAASASSRTVIAEAIPETRTVNMQKRRERRQKAAAARRRRAGRA